MIDPNQAFLRRHIQKLAKPKRGSGVIMIRCEVCKLNKVITREVWMDHDVTILCKQCGNIDHWEIV